MSDHYPVEVTLKPKIHSGLQDKISCLNSVVLRDNRPSDFASVTELKTLLSHLPEGYKVQVFQGVDEGEERFLATISGQCDSAEGVRSSLRTLRESSPHFLPYSLLAFSNFKLDGIESKKPGTGVFKYVLFISNEETEIYLCF